MEPQIYVLASSATATRRASSSTSGRVLDSASDSDSASELSEELLGLYCSPEDASLYKAHKRTITRLSKKGG
jgi:hypothetical protein